MEEIAARLLALSDAVRYVAIRSSNSLVLRERQGLLLASSAESDKYEELWVNPTLVALLKARGELDCGGLRFVLIRYGNFFQLVVPKADGHVSVAVEPTSRLDDVIPALLETIEANSVGADTDAG